MESGRIAELQRAIEELKEKSQNDQKRIVKRLKELHDQERQKIVEDYENRLAKQTQEHAENIRSKQSELDVSSERLNLMSKMVDKLKQARVDLLDKLERKDADFAAKEESLFSEIDKLKVEISSLKQTNAEDSRELQEVSAGYVLEIRQLQEQLAAAQATMKVVLQDNFEVAAARHDSEYDPGRLQELAQSNDELNAELSKLKLAYESSVQECSSLRAEFESESSKVNRLELELSSALMNSENLQETISDMQKELASLREDNSNQSAVIDRLESEIQSLVVPKNALADHTPNSTSNSSLAKKTNALTNETSELIETLTNKSSETVETQVPHDQINAYKERIVELESQLQTKDGNQSKSTVKGGPRNDGDQLIPNYHDSDTERLSFCEKCQRALANDEEHLLQLEQHTPSTFELSSTYTGRIITYVEQLSHFQGLAADRMKDFKALEQLSRKFDQRDLATGNFQIKYDGLAQSELHWHTICGHQQDVIISLIQELSGQCEKTSTVQVLKQANQRLKDIIKEQIKQHKERISNADDRLSQTETALIAEKKKVQQLVAALKKMKESSSATAESQTLRQDLSSALSRAEDAENQVTHLQRSLEMIELAQKDSLKEQRSMTAKVQQLTSALQVEQERAKSLESEKQQISSLLIRANKAVAELKDVNQIISGQLSTLKSMVSEHWLLDMTTFAETQSVAEFTVNQRCQIGTNWWLFIVADLNSADSTTTRSFWTTVEAFDNYSGKKIVSGLMADTELLHSRSACVLSTGVVLPESIESQSEAGLKSKFDKKWNSAAKRYEKKVAELNEKLQSSHSEIEKLTSEFEDYRKQATLALEKNSGGAVKMAELLDKIDSLEQERDALQHSLHEADQRTVDQTNVEIQRLQDVIETTRAMFHQSEVKWSQELQAVQVENERLISKNQNEESELIRSLTERLKIAQDELQRHRQSATEIIKERDGTISDLHKKFVAAQESSRDLEQQIRFLQAELVSLKQTDPQVLKGSHAALSNASQQEHQQKQPKLQLSPDHRRSRTDSTDQINQIQKLQSLLKDAELQREHQAAQMRQLQFQVRELSKSNERSGANLDYLKHVVVKYMETDESLTLLPVIANILAFDPDETERIRAKLEKTSGASLLPKIW